MRHRRELVRLNPLPVEQHPFLVAARTEVPRLARVREQVVVTASVAVDANGEASVEMWLGDDWRVNLDDRLLSSLAEWLRPENVEVIYS